MKTLKIAFATFLAFASTGANAAGKVALTFDDLPVFGLYSATEGEQVTRKLLDGLKRGYFPAIGFVNESQLDVRDHEQRVALLKDWLDAGMDLGNHSYSHPSLTNTPVEAYIADVAKGERATKTLLAGRGRKERWYRYPYLETGKTLEDRQRLDGWLAEHGYRAAPVTMENSDWEFAGPYISALTDGKAAQAEHIRASYLDYTRQIVPWYRKAAVQLLGREPAFVFLLHASRLNADTNDDLAVIFRQNGLKGVKLNRAMKDPAYRIVDTYVGPNGNGWLTRWSMTLHKDLPWAILPKVPDDIVALYAQYAARLKATPAQAIRLAPGS